MKQLVIICSFLFVGSAGVATLVSYQNATVRRAAAAQVTKAEAEAVANNARLEAEIAALKQAQADAAALEAKKAEAAKPKCDPTADINSGNFCLIGLLNTAVTNDSEAPTVPWGSDAALGVDDVAAQGDSWGDPIGDAFGVGMLGLESGKK